MRSASWLVWVLVAAATGCLTPVVDNLCRNHSECAPGLECIDGTCLPFGTAGGGVGGANGGGSGGANGGGFGGGGGGSACGPSTCAGCCAGGTCLPGVDSNACGRAGQSCTTCPQPLTCIAGAGVCGQPGGGIGGGTGGGFGGGGGGSGCGPTNCNGCCSASGVCMAGGDRRECGIGGNVCADCGPAGLCSMGFCFGTGGGGGGGFGGGAGGGFGGGGGGGGAFCDATNCRGCCAINGCMPGNDALQCGFGGAACVNCGPNALCSMGVCFGVTGGGGGGFGGGAGGGFGGGGGGGGGGTTCRGCVDSNGLCRSGLSNLACGVGGVMCQQCPFGAQCSNGACVMPSCGPMSCSGCCSGGQCVPLFQQHAGLCGFGGTVCGACAPGASCVGGTCQASCDGMTCPNGCCDFQGQCIVGGGPGACGLFGQFCSTCFPGQVCSGGVCVGGTGGGGGGFPFDGGFGGGGGGGGFPFDGGFGGVTAGSACTNDSSCQPPFQQVCLPQTTAAGTSTGYPGGYCTARCSPMMPCSSGVCVHETSTDPGSCKQDCFGPGMGQQSCRSGYVCAVGDTPIPQLIGWCRPRCTNGALAACPSGTTCNVGTGYCQ